MITIITSTKNEEKNLNSYFKSIQKIKNQNIELIIIDGKSTDSSMEIFEINKILIDVLIHESDTGIYNAWNKGVKIAKGEWIIFLGADDEINQKEFNQYLEYINDIKVESVNLISGKVQFGKNKIIGQPFEHNLINKKMMIAHVGSATKRELLIEYGLFNENYKICSDYDFLIKAKKSIHACYFDRVIVNMGKNGISNRISAGVILEPIYIKYSNVKNYSIIQLIFEINFNFIKILIKKIIK